MECDEASKEFTLWLEAFGQALSAQDTVAASSLFGDESYWRDLIAFTWTIQTLEGKAAIQAMLDQCLAAALPLAWSLDGPAKRAGDIVEGRICFETRIGRGSGYVRLKAGTCWTLLTAMTELKGFEEKRGRTREYGAVRPGAADPRSWVDRREAELAELGVTQQPYCLIVGGGQGGLALGARLKQLGVPALVIDKYDRVGDNWRNRYRSLCLHDPVHHNHMPYIPFPDNWPVFTPKDKIADWLEMYAKVMDLNVWPKTTCLSAQYDAAAKRWAVELERGGERMTLAPAHLVLATGLAGLPSLPTIPGMERFEGVQHHSSAHPSGDAFAGKRCVVFGSNTSAHDICADLVAHGADVTMVQRSSTHVIKMDTFVRIQYDRLYSETAVASGMSTELADLTAASMPYRLVTEIHKDLYRRVAAEDAEFYARLKAAGFKYDFGEDETGLSLLFLRRGAGYYIDVGASELIASGAIKIRNGAGAAEIEAHCVRFDDGSEIPADVIVYATGYGPLSGWVEQLISKEVAEAVGPIWGLGSDTRQDPGPWEGELRNMWKPTAQEGLWFQAGNIAQSRHFSRYLALQLKARFEGLPTPVYSRVSDAEPAREVAYV